MSFTIRCGQKVWPYLIVIFITGFCAFLTWFSLAAAGVAPHVNFGWTVAVSMLVGLGMLGHVFNCMRRHCRHGGTTANDKVSR